MIRVMLATINLDHMYTFERHNPVWSDFANIATSMNTTSIILALRLFSASIRWQLHKTIKVDKK